VRDTHAVGYWIKNVGLIHVTYHPVFITEWRTFWILSLMVK